MSCERVKHLLMGEVLRCSFWPMIGPEIMRSLPACSRATFAKKASCSEGDRSYRHSIAAMTPYPSYETSRKSKFSKVAFGNLFAVARPIATPLMSIPLTLAASKNSACVKWPSPQPSSRTVSRSRTAPRFVAMRCRASVHRKYAKGRHSRNTRRSLKRFAQADPEKFRSLKAQPRIFLFRNQNIIRNITRFGPSKSISLARDQFP